MATVCSITRSQFHSHAKPQSATVAGVPLALAAKEFSTHSLGWGANGKVTIDINGVPTYCQVGVNVTVIGSKELSA